MNPSPRKDSHRPYRGSASPLGIWCRLSPLVILIVAQSLYASVAVAGLWPVRHAAPLLAGAAGMALFGLVFGRRLWFRRTEKPDAA